ncbi:Casein kinase I isoform gamma-2 like protein [Verticillium longisporum]|nr:Casein kinase I isoform gamma-2 like protein [Verticillium longisporum]
MPSERPEVKTLVLVSTNDPHAHMHRQDASIAHLSEARLTLGIPSTRSYYRRVRDFDGFDYSTPAPTDRAPNVVFFGDHGRSRLLVMDLLGPSLEDLLDYCGRRFTIETVVMIGVQLITILEELHDRDFIHRDIKAENFVIQGGTERPNVVRAIDFATAKKYRSGNPPKHIMYREGRQFIGTARYASINTHMGCEQSRRDDLEALWYLLLYFIRGTLPWQFATPTPIAEKHKKIREAKQTATIEDLCEGRPELCAGLRYIRRLGFEEDPDYNYLRGQLVQAFEEGTGDVENGQYDLDKLPSTVRLAAQSLTLLPHKPQRQQSLPQAFTEDIVLTNERLSKPSSK